MAKLIRVAKSLNATRRLGVVLEADKNLHLEAHIDGSFAVHPLDYRSHSGGYVTIGQGPVWTKSTKQKQNTKSTTEMELVAVSDCSPYVLCARRFLIYQGYGESPAIVYQDNMATIRLLGRGGPASSQTRYIYSHSLLLGS
jgi:hypothetical protein